MNRPDHDQTGRDRLRREALTGRGGTAARLALTALLAMGASASPAAQQRDVPPNAERAVPELPSSDASVGRLAAAREVIPAIPTEMTLQLIDTAHQANFSSGSDELTVTARDRLDAFVASLRTHRDRAMALAMLLGGLRSAEVRGLLLCDADMGRRRLRVTETADEVIARVIEFRRAVFEKSCQGPKRIENDS